MANTTKGYPYPVDSDEADVPSDVQLLAQAVDSTPGIASLTQTQINSLTAPERWAGRVVWNQTTNRHQRSDGSTWTNVPLPVEVQSSQPTMAAGDAWLDTSASA